MGAIQGLFSRETIEVRAVDRMNLEMAEGEVVGYIGANGAGKSTTIKMLTGILLPTSGEISIAGFIPHRDRRKYVRSIGVVFGQRTQLWWDLAPVESFHLLGKIYEIPQKSYLDRIAELTELLSMQEFMNTPVRKLSLGQRMRCDLAAALLHRPRILFLDEPTIGLDVAAKARVREFLLRINQDERITVLLTTHDLDEIEKLCQRIVIIDRGQKIYDGSMERLLDQSGSLKKMTVDFESAPSPESLQELESRGIVCRNVEEVRWEFSYPRATSSAEIMQLIMTQTPVIDVKIEEPGIESVVTEIYTKSGPILS